MRAKEIRSKFVGENIEVRQTLFTTSRRVSFSCLARFLAVFPPSLGAPRIAEILISEKKKQKKYI